MHYLIPVRFITYIEALEETRMSVALFRISCYKQNLNALWCVIHIPNYS